MDDLPYHVEYAKTGRSSCRGCKEPIGQGTVRLAVMVRSPMFDGKTANWYHSNCFFLKQRPKTVDDIAHFEALRWEDQEKIKNNIGNATGSIPESSGKNGKKRGADAVNAKKTVLADFCIEYSKSSRATCRGCEQKIMKSEIRISKKDFESDIGKRYGGQDKWHHVECFAKLRSELEYYAGGDELPGFKKLSKDDQAEITKQLPPVEQDEPENKKPIIEENKIDEKKEKQMQEQNKVIYNYRDQLQALTRNQLLQIITENNQVIPEGGTDEILDRISDIMTFGSLERCEKCNGGQFVFHKFGYICTGNLTAWTKCNNFVKVPKRKAFVVPTNLKKKFPFLKKYKYKKRDRAVKDGQPPSNTVVKSEKKEEGEHKAKVQREKPPLYDMEIVIIGKLSRTEKNLKKLITSLGGKLVNAIKGTVMAVVSTPEEVEKKGLKIKQAEDKDIQVVSEDFLDEAKDYAGRIPELVQKKCICNWGSDPNKRLPSEASSSKSRSMYMKSEPSMKKFTVKGGTAVDPDTKLQNEAHIYTEGSTKYSAVLGRTDIQSGQNSYYILQLIESDDGLRFWVYCAWGRIGTSIGGKLLTEKRSVYAAKMSFYKIYFQQTKNKWNQSSEFIKYPGKMYPIDIDYGDDDLELLEQQSGSSKLSRPVQDLMQLIFNIKNMKQVMTEFELDMEKMPLGKLSKKQLQSALSVLTELQNLVNDNNTDQQMLVDATNRFYTLVPHSFGIDNPPLIDNIEDIKKKIEMIESLMEIEITYNMMKESTSKGGSPIDAQFEQLNIEIDVLNHDTKEFGIIKEYVQKTHAPTHSNYELEVEEVFIVKRHGEQERFKPYENLYNRKLLWHGSRTTNFGGILSQGLRIAPPEAPVSGYMFGKGIYFADMVSKSANYCFTSSMNPTGLLLLCEVALGHMFELRFANYVEKPPDGMHSVKGMGRMYPDHGEYKKIHDIIEVPVGRPVTNINVNTSLLYNEYIVYDVGQVQIRYLVRMNFKYKY